ncbi:CLUMA_CG011581, isoform A [Clunio marinus]|uniref:CLUMA_CG011581, isoform A n=1 Tax=Clunio marinus TaxID=568069 RepID=A0A1J1IEM2_9DIPT|nr:CLUMA_CG011581, isoform A [Clunio marinus]
MCLKSKKLISKCRSSTSYGEKNLTAKNSTSYCVTSELVHNIEDVVVGDSQDFEESDEDMAIKRTIRVDLIVAEDNVIELKPKSRKCLFRSEPNSEYFNVYTKDLCKIDCRIKRSLMFCKCVPFFYAIPNVETCDIKGMICLSESQWYNTSSCECPNLCEEVIYTRISTEKDNTGPSFSGVTIFLQFSKTRIIRSVLFNFNDLLVGLGGCVSFFLGFSFLTGVELFYSTFECVIEFIINIFQSRKRNISSY